ncbi:hypothetical protein [Vibrio harveyi]|uniref:hypothetical protein n=1 Tax=Vibrio harveyi TaxID=669 RepID=UPI0025B0C917|nr:hypothetical protein [Vibrio harveyi]WJT09277.1 hypothetical protein PH545_24945 [Vibrio harveyi]
MQEDLDQALDSGNEADIDSELDGLEFDGALLFGDDDDDELDGDDDDDELDGDDGDDTGVQNNEDGAQDDGGEDLPAVIDTTGTVESGAEHQHEDDAQTQHDGDKEGYKEIDGQLYVAVNADNAEVASKNGKHTIPYGVITRHRDQEKELHGQIADLKAQLDSAGTATKRNEILTKQLEEAGITPERLPEEVLNDPNAIQTIVDEIDGPAGQIIAALLSKVQGSQQQQQQEQEQEQEQAPQGDNPLDLPELAELSGWRESDQDRWETAIIIDKSLMRDPKFASLTTAERFVEVQKRVKSSFGDPVTDAIQEEQQQKQEQQAQQQQQQQQQAKAPNSPGSIAGGGQDTKAAAQQAMINQDALALEHAMENMSPEDLDALLMEAGGSL